MRVVVALGENAQVRRAKRREKTGPARSCPPAVAP